MAGGNLIRKKSQILINTLASGDVAVNSGKLFIKQYGNEIDIDNVTSFVKVENVTATKKVSRVLVKPVYPINDDYGYEGGISVQRDYSFNGNPQDFYGHSKAYTYRIDNLKTASSGYLNLEDRAEIVGYIVDMINDDPTAVVTAKARYYLAYTGSATMAVSTLAGTVVVASGTQAAVSNLHTAVEAATVATIVPVNDSTNGIWLTASKGLAFTLATGWALGESWIELTQKDNAHQFSTYILNDVGTESVVTAGVKEILPLTEVQQLFPILPVSGIGSTPNIPIAGTAYCKYVFYIDHPDAAGLVGASRRETSEEVVEFYLPTTVGEGLLWETIMNPSLHTAGVLDVDLGNITATISATNTGFVTVDAVPGFTVSSVEYFKASAGVGTINKTTGAFGGTLTIADVFFAEIKYAHLDYYIVSSVTLAAVTAGVTAGHALTAAEVLSYEYLGRFDVTLASGLGTPTIRDFGAVINRVTWAFESTAAGNASTGEVTSAGSGDETITAVLYYTGKVAARTVTCENTNQNAANYSATYA
jgi:hypothetical protein